jgi:hypothetical protein
MTISEKLGAFESNNKFISYNMTISESFAKIPKQNETIANKTIINNQNLINLNPITILNMLHKKGAINGYQLADSKKRIKQNKPLKNAVKIHYDYYLKTIKGQLGKNSQNHRKKAESPLYKTFIPITINHINYAIKIKRAIYKDYLPKAPKDNIENWGEKSINYLFWDSKNIESNIIAETKRELINKALNMPQISKLTIRGIIGAFDSQKGGNLAIKSPFYLTNKGAIKKPFNYSLIEYNKIYQLAIKGNNWAIMPILSENMPKSPIIDYQKLINNPIDYYSIYPKNRGAINNE